MDLLERLTGGLLLVIGIIWIGAYLYSRLYGLNNRGGRNLVRIVASSAIAPKKVITIVEIAGEYLVLGMTPDQITYLTRIKDPETVRMIEGSKETNEEEGFKGRNFLLSFLKRGGKG